MTMSVGATAGAHHTSMADLQKQMLKDEQKLEKDAVAHADPKILALDQATLKMDQAAIAAAESQQTTTQSLQGLTTQNLLTQSLSQPQAAAAPTTSQTTTTSQDPTARYL